MGTNIDYYAVAHHTIVAKIGGGAGVAPLGGVGSEWARIADQLQGIHEEVVQAIQGIRAAQQGAAADAATRATMPLAPWVNDLAIASKGVASRIEAQAEYYQHTVHSMPPPRDIPDVSWSQDRGEAVADVFLDWLPGAQTDEERIRVLAQQDEQRAQDLMMAYQANSNENLDAAVQLAPPPTVLAEVTEPSLRGGGGPTDGLGAHPAPAGAGAGGPAAATASQLAAAPQAAMTPHQSAGGYPDQGVQHGPGSGQVRPGVPAAFGPSPGFAGSGPAGDRSRAGSRYPNTAGRGAGGARAVGGVGGAASRGSGFGSRPGGRAASSGGTAPSGGGFGPSGSSAEAVRDGAEQGSAGRGGAAGARGGAGSGMPAFGGAPGGGRGGSSDDIERRRPSYLIEHEVNAIVGELPRTAPPVIGTDEDP